MLLTIRAHDGIRRAIRCACRATYAVPRGCRVWRSECGGGVKWEVTK